MNDLTVTVLSSIYYWGYGAKIPNDMDLNSTF